MQMQIVHWCNEVVEVAKWAFENRMGTLMLHSGECLAVCSGCALRCVLAALCGWRCCALLAARATPHTYP
jgi:hypothetical protein